MSKQAVKSKPKIKKIEFDLEQLRHWKSVSTRGKLEWLESALRFGKLRKF